MPKGSLGANHGWPPGRHRAMDSLDMPSPIILHDSLGRLDDRPGRKKRFRHRSGRVSRHDVLWADVEPALTRPARPWDRPLPRPSAHRRARTHGRAAKRRRQ